MRNDLSSDQFMLSTLPETNKVLAHRSSQKEFHLPTILFQGQTVRFRDGKHMFTTPKSSRFFWYLAGHGKAPQRPWRSPNKQTKEGNRGGWNMAPYEHI